MMSELGYKEHLIVVQRKGGNLKTCSHILEICDEDNRIHFRQQYDNGSANMDELERMGMRIIDVMEEEKELRLKARENIVDWYKE
jgi:hypothetical protein